MGGRLRILLFPILLSALLSASPGTAAEGGEDVSSPLLRRIETISAGIETIGSAFVQEKHLSVFKEVMISKGRFYLQKPDRLRWEMKSPVEAGFVMAGDRGRRWNRRSGESEEFSSRRNPMMKLIAGQLLAWARADFEKLHRDYLIAVVDEEPVTLRLTPRGDSRKGPIEHLTVTFSPGEKHIERVRLEERDGDFTLLIFTDTTLNAVLPKSLFEW